MEVGEKPRSVDPILNLPVQSSVTSICFVSRKSSSESSRECFRSTKLDSGKLIHPNDSGTSDTDRLGDSNEDDDNNFGGSGGDDSDDSDSDDEDGELKFRSSTIRVEKPYSPSFPGHSHRLLSDRFLASCHRDGEALIWDLANQKRVAFVSPPRGGAGVCIRRTDDPSQIMFQTRDPKGTVSLHSIERCSSGEQDHRSSFSSARTSVTASRQFETCSQTFCQAAPCHGNKHLFALPSVDHSTVTVVDDRTDTDVATYSIDGHGMVTSLALSVTTNNAGDNTGRPLLACGMESGTVVFFDVIHGATKPFSKSSFPVGKDPVLTLDLLPSRVAPSLTSLPDACNPNALLVAAGMAGDAQDISEMSDQEAGRAVMFKTIYYYVDNNDHVWNFKQRARLATCRVDRESFNGKPGVSICRFRPNDGRLLAVGSWDKRIRLFERSKGGTMAILKGNPGSIIDLDWAQDSMTSGLLASANKDDKLISFWQCFAKG